MIDLRPMEIDDVGLIERWDRDADVMAAIGGTAIDWYDWHTELRREVEWRELLIVEEEGRPVGFVQLTDAHMEESHYWGDVEPGTWSLDIWIGEPADRARGVGRGRGSSTPAAGAGPPRRPTPTRCRQVDRYRLGH